MEAVVKVAEWTTTHDAIIKLLDDPQMAETVRQETESHKMKPVISGVIKAQDMDMLPTEFDPLDAAVAGLKAADQNIEFDNQDRLIRYRAILEASFGSHVAVPSDPDKRDEYDLVKRKLERRVADIAGDPNTIGAIAENYYRENQIRSGTRRKYRGNIKKLTDFLGDIPITHVTSKSLRRFRDQQSALMIATSLAAVFTSIRGMFRYAIDEELIETNPMQSVVLKRDKRSIHERKCIPYPPREMKRLLEAVDEHWGSPKRGLSDERRVAIHMVCRVMAFSCLRPIEVVRLESEDVTANGLRYVNPRHHHHTEQSHYTLPCLTFPHSCSMSLRLSAVPLYSLLMVVVMSMLN